MRRRALLAALLLTAACSDAPDEAPAAGAPAAPDTGVLARISRPVEGGGLHLVRLVARGSAYAFDPAEVRVRPGDVVRFVLAHPQPEAIAFDTLAADSTARRYLAASDLMHGTLLTQPGQVYDVRFGDAPAGRYPFFSVPHAGEGMTGVVVVE